MNILSILKKKILFDIKKDEHSDLMYKHRSTLNLTEELHTQN